MSDTTLQNWQPGYHAIISLPATVAEVETHMNTEADYTDWYFGKKDVAA